MRYRLEDRKPTCDPQKKIAYRWIGYLYANGEGVPQNDIQAGDVPAAVEFGRVATAPVNTLRQQTHRCQEISVCF